MEWAYLISSVYMSMCGVRRAEPQAQEAQHVDHKEMWSYGSRTQEKNATLEKYMESPVSLSLFKDMIEDGHKPDKQNYRQAVLRADR